MQVKLINENIKLYKIELSNGKTDKELLSNKELQFKEHPKKLIDHLNQ